MLSPCINPWNFQKKPTPTDFLSFEIGKTPLSWGRGCVFPFYLLWSDKKSHQVTPFLRSILKLPFQSLAWCLALGAILGARDDVEDFASWKVGSAVLCYGMLRCFGCDILEYEQKMAWKNRLQTNITWHYIYIYGHLRYSGQDLGEFAFRSLLPWFYPLSPGLIHSKNDGNQWNRVRISNREVDIVVLVCKPFLHLNHESFAE